MIVLHQFSGGYHLEKKKLQVYVSFALRVRIHVSLSLSEPVRPRCLVFSPRPVIAQGHNLPQTRNRFRMQRIRGVMSCSAVRVRSTIVFARQVLPVLQSNPTAINLVTTAYNLFAQAASRRQLQKQTLLAEICRSMKRCSGKRKNTSRTHSVVVDGFRRRPLREFESKK